MIKKWLSLLLAACLALSLAACSSNEDEPQLPEDGDTSVSDNENNQPSDDPANTQPDDTAQPENTPGTSTEPTEPDSSAPEQPETKPDDTVANDTKPSAPESSKPESSKPETPSTPDTPSAPDKTEDTAEDAGNFTIEDIWADIQTALSGTLPSLSALDASTVTTLYPLSTDDLAEYGCYGSLIGVQATEFFIAKVQSGRMDAVKDAILSRQSDMEEQWRQYLPAQYELVQNYQLVQNGDYIFFGVAENVSAAVDVFNQYTK